MTFQPPLFGPGASRAKTSASPEWDQGAVCGDDSPDSSTRLLTSLDSVAPKLLSSRTLQHFSLPTMDEISQSSYGRWPNSGMAWLGECLTVDPSAPPKAARESSLSDLWEDPPVPERYFLSPNAATGMLRRAERMGRNLF